ncbi:MAG: L,D-transpeptidase family protein [Marinilabiliales bacterium]|nr:L,D-transpeptidase family protein [Marinilabiliales bacterium]
MSAAERLKQIRANLERWRWITPDLGERYVLVNVADFRVAVYEAGREVLSMAAVVGRAYRQTPDFSGVMSTITLNPAWNVPPKLAREDILPKVRKDPGLSQEKGLPRLRELGRERRGDRCRRRRLAPVRRGPHVLQVPPDPGPQNSLGRIMFLFPNKYDVYIHDHARALAFRPGRPGFQLGLHPDREAFRAGRLCPAGTTPPGRREDRRGGGRADDPSHLAPGAPEGPRALLDGVARRGWAGPVPSGHLSQGCGPGQGLG